MLDLGLVDLHALIDSFIPRNRLDQYYQLLMEENRRVNLVSRETTRADFDRLIGESILPIKQIRTPVQDYLDIGAGGGIPAVPLLLAGVVSGRATLLERTRKKAQALEAILGGLGISAEVVPQSFADLRNLPYYDLVTIRYVKLTSPLLAGALRVLRSGGNLIYYGPATAERSELKTRSYVFRSSQDSAAKNLTIFQK